MFIAILKKYMGIVVLAVITLLSVTTIENHLINAGLNNKGAQLASKQEQTRGRFYCLVG